jgi:hypothetical protein
VEVNILDFVRAHKFKNLKNVAVIINVWFFNTRWFKYDWDYLCVNKSQFVPVIFEPPCIFHDTVCLLFLQLLKFVLTVYVCRIQFLAHYRVCILVCIWIQNTDNTNLSSGRFRVSNEECLVKNVVRRRQLCNKLLYFAVFIGRVSQFFFFLSVFSAGFWGQRADCALRGRGCCAVWGLPNNMLPIFLQCTWFRAPKVVYGNRLW